VVTNQKPEADEHLGWGEAVAVILGDQAIREGKRIWFKDYVRNAGGERESSKA
jgi:hypothetical protein